MSGGGVDASIPLQAGRGAAQPDPLATIGRFATIQNQINQGQLQQQQLASGKMSLAQQTKQMIAAHLAPLIAQGRIKTTADATDALAGLEHTYKLPTGDAVNEMLGIANRDGSFPDNVATWTAANLHSAENMAPAITPRMNLIDVGGGTLPMTTPAPLLGRQTPTASGPLIEKGYTPSEGLEQQQVPATQADVDASGGSLVLNQPIWKRRVNMVGPNPNPGGNRVPIPSGSLGLGGYPSQKPLDQLGAPYRPAVTPNTRPAPTNVPPGVGWRLMKGPGGPVWVAPDKVTIFQQNGYN